MELFNILLIVTIGLAFLTLVAIGVFAWMFVARKRTVVNIIYENKRRKKHVFKGPMEARFSIENKTYLYDSDCEVKTYFGDHIYYFYNNPNPVVWDFKAHKVKTDSKELDSLLNTNLIEKLFRAGNIEQQLLVMLFILIGLVVVNIAIQFFVKPSISLQADPVTLETIASGVRMALQ